MTRQEELLLRFQDGIASPEELRELSALLEGREARAALVEDFLMSSAIRGHLRAEPERKTGSRRFDRTRRFPLQRPSRTWAWVAAGAAAAVFAILLFSSSPEETPKTTAKRPAPPVPLAVKPTLPKVETEPEPQPVPAPPPRPPEPPRRPAPPQDPVRQEPAPAPREEPKPPAPPEIKPAPEPAKPARSQVVGIARIEKVDGTAFIVAKEGKTPALAGTEIAAGQGLETGGSESRIVFSFPDKTQVEVGPDSVLTDVKIEGGTRLAVAAGSIRADVAPQPKNKPMIVATPHAEAKVLGTLLHIVVDRDPKKGTLLEVEKGRVELKRLSDRKTVVVGAGQFAVAALGSDMKPKPLPPVVLVSYSFEDGKLGAGWVGTVEAGPARDGNRGCIRGPYLAQERLTRVSLSEDTNGLFNHVDGAVLSFDYWADGETSILSIYVWDRTQQLSIGGFENRNLTRRQWTRATVPLSELRDGEKRLQEGDVIKNLTIQTNQGNGILFIDNVEISVPRAK